MSRKRQSRFKTEAEFPKEHDDVCSAPLQPTWGAGLLGVRASEASSFSHDVENGGGEWAALGDTTFGAEGAVVVSRGAADEDGLVSKGVDEAKRLGPYSRVLQNLKVPTPVHGVECLAEIQKDAVEGHLLTGGELMVQRRLHDAGAVAPLGVDATQKIMELDL